MLEYLHLKNVGPAPEIELELAPRLNILTGDNGLGKSFLLDTAWWALTRRWPRDVNKTLVSGYPARPRDPRRPAAIAFRLESKTGSVSYESRFSNEDQAWIGNAGRPPNPGLVLYAHADGGFSVWDPARNYWKTRGQVDVQERLPAYVFSARDVWDGLDVEVDGARVPLCNGLIRDWSNWIQAATSDAGRMAEALKGLSPSQEPQDLLCPGLLQRLSVNDARDYPSVRSPIAGDVPIVHASAGVKRISALSYMLNWSWGEHRKAAAFLGQAATDQVVMLVDEIESHLHPRWQRTILGGLLQLIPAMHAGARVQLIAATHSPLILASAEPYFDRTQDAWFDMDLESDAVRNGGGKGANAEVVVRRREYARLGDVSNWLTSPAFDLQVARSVESERAILAARAVLADRGHATPIAVRTVDAALRKVLTDIDPFWVRWSAFAEPFLESVA